MTSVTLDGAHLQHSLIALVLGTLVSAFINGLIKPKLTETDIERDIIQALDKAQIGEIV